MRQDRPPIQPAAPDSRLLEARAAEHLRFIRDMMERSGSFTAVPGRGSMAMGATALIAAPTAGLQATPTGWLLIWLLTAAVAIVIGSVTLVRKARRSGMSLRSGPGRKYVLSLLPPFVAGLLLTGAVWHHEMVDLLPGLWLLLYGAGTITGGAFSIRIIPLSGVAFMVLGTAALLVPLTWGNVLLAAGFGGLHLLVGFIIAKNYGG